MKWTKWDYAEALKDPRWQRKRLEKMQSSEWKCDICGDAKEELNVHHKRYREGLAGRPLSPWTYGLDELECLCRSCHELSHVPQVKIKSFLEHKLKKDGTVPKSSPEHIWSFCELSAMEPDHPAFGALVALQTQVRKEWQEFCESVKKRRHEWFFSCYKKDEKAAVAA